MTLQELRAEIDRLDAQILQLLNQRAQCVVQIGAVKRQHHEAISVPEREKALLARLLQLNQGPLDQTAVQHLFQEIIETMKVLQTTPDESEL